MWVQILPWSLISYVSVNSYFTLQALLSSPVDEQALVSLQF